MNLTNQQIITIWNSLEHCKPSPPIPVSFVSWRNKTKLTLEPFIKSLEKASKLGDEFNDDIDHRKKDLVNLQKTMSLKDPKTGEAMRTGNGDYKIMNMDEFNKEADQIVKFVYTDLYNEEERVRKEYNALLEEIEDVNVKILPDEKLPVNWESM